MQYNQVGENGFQKIISLTHISSILNSNLNIYQLMSLIMLYSKDLLEAEASSLFLMNEKDNFLYCEVALGEKGEMIQKYIRLELGQGIAGWVAKNKKPIYIEDAYKDNRFDPTWDKKTGFKTKSLICVPLFLREKLIGTLEVINKTTNNNFDKFDLELLTIIAENAAVAIYNSQQQDSLNKKLLELSLLYEFEKKITSERDQYKLGGWILDRLLEYLEAKSGTIYTYDEKTQTLNALSARGIPEELAKTLSLKVGEGIAGWVAKEKQKILVQNLDEDPRYKKDLGFKFESSSLITVPMLVDSKLIGVISINNKKNGFAFNHNDLNMLEAIANRLGVMLHNYMLIKKIQESEKEKERAFKLMKEILPVVTPEIKGLNIASQYKPYDDIGGDFFKFFPINNNQTGIFIADISGHGLSSSLLALMASSMLNTFEEIVYTSPSVLLSGLNSLLFDKMAGNFLTGFYACIDTEKNELIYSNAGHPFPFIWDSNQQQLKKLFSKGKLIGVLPHVIFEEQRVPFQKGDKLILFTDGLLETTMDGRSIRLEETRFEDNILQFCKQGLSPMEMIHRSLESINQYPEFTGFHDDVTFVVVERL